MQRRVRVSVTKEKIKSAGLKHFGIYGYEGTSMNDIANEVGIKKPSLYAHFSSKEEIFVVLMEDAIKCYSEHLQKIINESSGEDSGIDLYEIFVKFASFFSGSQEHKYFWNRLYLFPPSFVKEKVYNEMMDIEYQFIKSLFMIFKNGIRRGEIRQSNIEDMVMVYYYMINGFITCAGLNSEEDFSARLKGSWNVYWEGIRKNN